MKLFRYQAYSLQGTPAQSRRCLSVHRLANGRYQPAFFVADEHGNWKVDTLLGSKTFKKYSQASNETGRYRFDGICYIKMPTKLIPVHRTLESEWFFSHPPPEVRFYGAGNDFRCFHSQWINAGLPRADLMPLGDVNGRPAEYFDVELPQGNTPYRNTLELFVRYELVVGCLNLDLMPQVRQMTG